MPQLMGGAQIRNVRDRGNVGTLGCVVCSRKNPAERYLLTAGHVINAGGYAREGDVIEAKLPG